MALTLEWIEGYSDRYRQREVANVADLDHAMDELTARAEAIGTPFNVNLVHSDDTSMDIVVGADVALVQWIRDEPWSCLGAVDRSAAGPDEDGDLLVFAGNGQYSEWPRRDGLAVPIARAVMRHYFETRELASFVQWDLI